MTVLTHRHLDRSDVLTSSRPINDQELWSTRFPIVDTFEGEILDPQSLHKYLYVHGDPIQGVDPTGKYLGGVVGFLVGFAISRRIDGFYNKTVIRAGGTAIGVLFDLLAFRYLGGFRDGTIQYPERRFDQNVHANYHELKIVNAELTADQIFKRLTEFRYDDFEGSPARPVKETNSMGQIGDVLTWDMSGFFEEFGQPDFDVSVHRIDSNRRFVAVVTMNGHPLSGFRFWEVIADSGSSHEYTIRTGAVEHNTSWYDSIKAYIGGPRIGWPPWTNSFSGVDQTWDAQMNALLKYSKGQSPNGIQSEWDDSKIFEFKQKVSWQFSK